jgi:hypothetical protein
MVKACLRGLFHRTYRELKQKEKAIERAAEGFEASLYLLFAIFNSIF